MGSSNHVSDGEVGGSKAGGQPLVDTCRNRRGRSREGGEVMKYAQNLVLNRCSRTSLLMVFLYLAHKEKRFYKMAKKLSAICSLQKRIAGVFCITALPHPSLPDPGKGEKQFIYIINTFMLGNTRLWDSVDKVECILCFIGDWNREKCFLLN